MKKYIVDTNVPIVANGRSEDNVGKVVSVACRAAAITFLIDVLKNGKIFVDLAGEIQGEYHRYLNVFGQPGVGDRFYQEVLHSAPTRIIRVELEKDANGEFNDLASAIVNSGFDPSDRKFAALSTKVKVPVFNATDSDWVDHSLLLKANGVDVFNLCGCSQDSWFTATL